MSGLGICCELPEVIRSASEGLDKPGAVVARQHAFACLEAKPLGHNACVPPVGRLEEGILLQLHLLGAWNAMNI